MMYYYFKLALLTLSAGTCITIKVFTTTEKYGLFRDGSGAKLINPSNVSLTEATVCFRIFQMLPSSIGYVSLGKKTLNFFTFHEVSYISWDETYYFKVVKEGPLLLMEWNHICFGFNMRTKNLSIVNNGQVVMVEVVEIGKKEVVDKDTENKQI